MKKTQKLLLTLLIAALAMPAMALASEPTAEGTEVSVALEEEIALPDDGEAPAEEGTPEAAQPDGEAVTVYNFIVENALLAAQEAREGDAILRPDDPAAPGGYVFAGWYLEDGTALFVDGDGDGEIDAVITHLDQQMPDVNVFARFVEAEEKPSPDGEGTEAEEPSVEEEATAEPQKPSPDGEGGATAPDEVSSPDETNAENEGEEAPAPALPTANALTYTGEAQALVSGEGWLYSLDGETYSEAIPTGINAGEYIVYFKAAGDAEPQTLLVTIAKADVVFTEPVAAATGD